MLDALLFGRKKMTMIDPDEALPGRPEPLFRIPERHEVLGTPLQGPFPAGLETALFGLGCFWGAEKLFWELPGVYTTSVGYAGGFTPNPTYEEVCSGQTGHTEAVQGNDLGTQYRSAIYYTTVAQRESAERSRDAYDAALKQAGFGPVTTEIAPAGPYYLAEDYHQQYLHKVPNGYCPHHSTGVGCPAWGTAPIEAQAARSS